MNNEHITLRSRLLSLALSLCAEIRGPAACICFELHNQAKLLLVSCSVTQQPSTESAFLRALQQTHRNLREPHSRSSIDIVGGYNQSLKRE